jgi:3D (Asp-Asp-Asp) domain-containing protein
MKNINKVILGTLVGFMVGINALAPVVSAAAVGGRVLKYGVAGDDVKQVQTQLIQMGFQAGAVDGVYGKNTQQAVRTFQQHRNIKDDGVIGQQTVQALKGSTNNMTAETNTEVSRGTTAPERSQKVLNIVATAYAPGYEDNGPWGNLTHIGTQVRPGIIAVDPNVIPLGSRVYIEFPDGHGTYALAEDTGGAIKGNRIDIAFWTRDEAKQFGIQNVKLHVLS